MASEEVNLRNWGQDVAIIHVMQQFGMPLALQQHGNAMLVTLRTVCKSWKSSCDDAPLERVKAKLWGTGDQASMAAFLRCHTRIQALELSADPDVSTILAQNRSIQELRELLLSIPPSLTSVALEGALAVPFSLVLCALHPMQLKHLSLLHPPDKWSFVPGMFPWEEAPIELIFSKHPNGIAPLHNIVDKLRWGGPPGLQGGPELYRAMYGQAVWERFKEAWLQFEQGVATCLWMLPGLESLALETPARSLCPGIVRCLTMPGNTVLRSMHLIGFGGKASSNADFGEDNIGLDLSTVSLLSSLTSLKLTACGVALTPAAAIESLTKLKELHLPNTSIIFTDHPPQLSGLVHLNELLLDHSEWLTPEGEIWGDEDEEDDEESSNDDNVPQQQQQQQQPFDLGSLAASLPINRANAHRVLLLPDNLAVLNVVGFDGPAPHLHPGLSRLSSLSFAYNSLKKGQLKVVSEAAGYNSLGTADEEPPHIISSLQHLSTNGSGLRQMGNCGLFRGCAVLQRLELSGMMPQHLQAHVLQTLPFLTRLAFKGEAEWEVLDEELGVNMAARGSPFAEDLISFAPQHGILSSLRELVLDVGCTGVVEMDLHHLTNLTSLVVDNIEFVDLTKTRLPTSLVSLTLYPWYGLPELYELQEGEPSSGKPPEGMHERLLPLERKAEFLLCDLLSTLTALESVKIMWDLAAIFRTCSAALSLGDKLPNVRELRLRWKKGLLAPDFAILHKICPHWERCCISSGTRKKLYVRMQQGCEDKNKLMVLCKTCGGKSEVLTLDAAQFPRIEHERVSL